jgi:DNA-binding response OmpR family regulator
MEKMKILLVDDEERFLITTQKLLAKKGIDVVTAASGAEALDLLKHKNIHVVILDVKMPGMDGNETLREIKARFPLVEVIMLTGHGTTESAVEGMKLGAFDYLLKPAHFGELTAKLESARQRKDEQTERIRKAEAKLLLRKSGDI